MGKRKCDFVRKQQSYFMLTTHSTIDSKSHRFKRQHHMQMAPQVTHKSIMVRILQLEQENNYH